MPTSAKNISVPEQIVYWWDTENDKLRTTEIRPLSFEVKGIPQSETVPSNSTPPEAESNKDAVIPDTTPKVQREFLWPAVAAIFFLLWVATILIMWRRKKRSSDQESGQAPHKSDEAQLRECAKALVKACDSQDEKHVYNLASALYHNLKEQHPHHQQLPEIRSAISGLEARLYGAQGAGSSQEEIAAIKAVVSNMSLHASSEPQIKPLYPV